MSHVFFPKYRFILAVEKLPNFVREFSILRIKRSAGRLFLCLDRAGRLRHCLFSFILKIENYSITIREEFSIRLRKAAFCLYFVYLELYSKQLNIDQTSKKAVVINDLKSYKIISLINDNTLFKIKFRKGILYFTFRF